MSAYYEQLIKHERKQKQSFFLFFNIHSQCVCVYVCACARICMNGDRLKEWSVSEDIY